jgi:predicted NBD/HSP70 family sugar kinase
MRNPAFPLAILVSAFVLAPSPAVSGEGTAYGEGVGKGQPVKVSELLTHPDGYVGKHVRVEGLITDVCPKRGCWMEIASDREFETIRFKVDDGVIVIPMDAKGKRVDAEGIFTKIEITKEQALAHAKHVAEETGETFDPAKAGDLPTVIYQIQGTGAVIR